MKLKSITLVLLAPGLFGLAHAESSTIDFTVDQSPAFSLNPSTPTAAGQWTSGNVFTGAASAFTRNESTGNYEGGPVTLVDSQTLPASATQGALFGQASVSQPDTGLQVSADLQVQANAIHTSAELKNPQAEAFGGAWFKWSRSFDLNPHSSITLSGHVDFGGDLATTVPVMSYHEFDSGSMNEFYSSEASLTASSGTDSRHYLNLAATLHEKDIGWPPVTAESHQLVNANNFSYSFGPDGAMSLTLFNNSDKAFSGTFALGINNSIQTAVPEPQAWLAMLLGLGVVGSVARRRKGPPSSTAAI